MLKSMRKILLSLISLGVIAFASTNVISCTQLNDLQKSFNYDNNVTVNNKEFTLQNLGLQQQGTQNVYDFNFLKLVPDIALEIIQVKPNKPVSNLYFQGTIPQESPNKDSEVAELTGNNHIGEKGLGENNNIVSIPLTVSLLISYPNVDSSTGFSYQFTGLIMNIKINVTLS